MADDWILLATALRLAAGAVQDPLERSALWSLRGMHGEHRSSIDEAIPIPVEDTWKTLQEDGRSLVNLRTAADCLGVVHHRLSWCDHKDADLVRRSCAILLRLLILLEEKQLEKAKVTLCTPKALLVCGICAGSSGHTSKSCSVYKLIVKLYAAKSYFIFF